MHARKRTEGGEDMFAKSQVVGKRSYPQMCCLVITGAKSLSMASIKSMKSSKRSTGLRRGRILYTPQVQTPLCIMHSSGYKEVGGMETRALLVFILPHRLQINRDGSRILSKGVM